jgi:hypothetical protein
VQEGAGFFSRYVNNGNLGKMVYKGDLVARRLWLQYADFSGLSTGLRFAELVSFYFFGLTQKSNKKGHPYRDAAIS